LADLRAVGVEHRTVSIKDYQGQLDAFAAERSYKNRDEVRTIPFGPSYLVPADTDRH